MRSGCKNEKDQRFVALQTMCAVGARSLVEAQMGLDEHGRASLLAWQTDGLPPAAWTWSECKLRLPLGFRLLSERPGSSPTGKVELAVSARNERQADCGKLSLTFRYIGVPYIEELADDAR